MAMAWWCSSSSPAALLGTAAPDGSHRVMLTGVGALQGSDLPVASSDGRYLVNLEGQLVTVSPAGPTSVSNLAERAGLTAAEQDPVTRELVLARLFGVAADGGALVLATHDPEVAERCDHVLSLARHLSAHGHFAG